MNFIRRFLILIVSLCWFIIIDTIYLKKDDLFYDEFHSILIFLEVLCYIAIVINGIIFCMASKKREKPSKSER